jgi:cell division protein FtsL
VTSYAERARVEPVRTRPARKPGRADGAARGRSTAGGVLWIAVLAVLLAGVVAVNVAVLRLNMRLDHASRQRVELQADVASLQSALSTAAANAQISRQGQRKLGLVAADPAKTTYVQLTP